MRPLLMKNIDNETHIEKVLAIHVGNPYVKDEEVYYVVVVLNVKLFSNF